MMASIAIANIAIGGVDAIGTEVFILYVFCICFVGKD